MEDTAGGPPRGPPGGPPIPAKQDLQLQQQMVGAPTAAAEGSSNLGAPKQGPPKCSLEGTSLSAAPVCAAAEEVGGARLRPFASKRAPGGPPRLEDIDPWSVSAASPQQQQNPGREPQLLLGAPHEEAPWGASWGAPRASGAPGGPPRAPTAAQSRLSELKEAKEDLKGYSKGSKDPWGPPQGGPLGRERRGPLYPRNPAREGAPREGGAPTTRLWGQQAQGGPTRTCKGGPQGAPRGKGAPQEAELGGPLRVSEATRLGGPHPQATRRHPYREQQQQQQQQQQHKGRLQEEVPHLGERWASNASRGAPRRGPLPAGEKRPSPYPCVRGSPRSSSSSSSSSRAQGVTSYHSPHRSWAQGYRRRRYSSSSSNSSRSSSSSISRKRCSSSISRRHRRRSSEGQFRRRRSSSRSSSSSSSRLLKQQQTAQQQQETGAGLPQQQPLHKRPKQPQPQQQQQQQEQKQQHQQQKGTALPPISGEIPA
ncbi:hypothetical protein, conserved [Eimeria tenella]|uniref:Uncharacterized protein n=1 Tax=Eimeria tenella TaxID=5802 RepID=U6L0D6_EIMTE|nr:hypothetical protein, conserved [Eimeria tenella]CDJ41225.1 hypothetical protein, conserved [Eimeria tenella]|eukprot:XP_013231975.1 hypothetical protein, conserved [Eimeria tenella]